MDRPLYPAWWQRVESTRHRPGKMLQEAQLAFLAAEFIAGTPPAERDALLAASQAAIDEALRVIRTTPEDALFEARGVSRAQLPTNVFGLLFHIAEHAQRHTGQLIATARVVRTIVSRE